MAYPEKALILMSLFLLWAYMQLHDEMCNIDFFLCIQATFVDPDTVYYERESSLALTHG